MRRAWLLLRSFAIGQPLLVWFGRNVLLYGHDLLEQHAG